MYQTQIIHHALYLRTIRTATKKIKHFQNAPSIYSKAIIIEDDINDNKGNMLVVREGIYNLGVHNTDKAPDNNGNS